MKLCAEKCFKEKDSCEEKQCRNWIKYDDDLNCVEIAIKKNGLMTLKQVGDRLGISYVRVTQIEKEALNKLQKNRFNKKDTNYNNH
jgi:DNA-directed RNA polymerase sigma subunit (sigma70/sigma32)